MILNSKTYKIPFTFPGFSSSFLLSPSTLQISVLALIFLAQVQQFESPTASAVLD